MRIVVTFFGGPFDGEKAAVETLERIEPFFIDEGQIVHVYIRENEVDYVYDDIMSREYSAKYDEYVAKFNKQISDSDLMFLTLLPEDVDQETFLADLDEEETEEDEFLGDSNAEGNPAD